MPERLLIDTDILIEYLRGRSEAADYLENLEGSLLISAITVAELYAGVRDEREQRHLQQFLLAFEVIPVNRKWDGWADCFAEIMARAMAQVWPMP